MANREIAQKVLTQITEKPQTHHQSQWAMRKKLIDDTGNEYCGTAMCVAGWATQFAHPESKPNFNGGYFADFVQLPDAEAEYYDRTGRLALEISDNEADWLFDEARTTDEVVNGLRQLIDVGEINVVDDVDEDDEEY